MRSALWLFFSPFAMVGGWLVGWFGHALHLTAPIDVNLAADFNQQMVLAGVCLIILGGFIRHYMMGRMKRQLRAQAVVIGADQQKIAVADQRADVANARLAVLRTMIAEMREDDLRFIMTDDDR